MCIKTCVWFKRNHVVSILEVNQYNAKNVFVGNKKKSYPQILTSLCVSLYLCGTFEEVLIRLCCMNGPVEQICSH